VRETDAIAADGQGIAGKRVTMNIDRAREWHLQIVTRRWQLRRLPVLRIVMRRLGSSKNRSTAGARPAGGPLRARRWQKR